MPFHRGVSAPEPRSLDWMLAARRVIKASRKRKNMALELDAWDHFVNAM
jgi:hypothetical protein